jgi:hypothetical protein
MKKYTIVPASIAIVVGIFLIAAGLLHTNQVGGGNPASNITHTNYNYILSISNGTMRVDPHSYTFYHFAAPNRSSNAHVHGDFALQGNGSNIRVYLLDEENFVNWKSAHQFNAYYDSGQQTTGAIDVSVPSGKTLYLIYDNSLSSIPSKRVFSNVNLVYNL